MAVNGDIQIATATLAEWTTWNGILKEGQMSIVKNPTTPAEKMKIGDGVTAWLSLEYFPKSAISTIIQDAVVDGVTDKVPTSNAVFDADAAVLTSSKAYTDSVLVGNFNFRGDWNGAGNNYPVTGGRGAGGLPLKGDAWEISTPCTIQGVNYDQGDLIVSKIDTPGQVVANWSVSEHNTQQATESIRGTAMLTPLVDAQNPLTGNGSSMSSAVRVWDSIKWWWGLMVASVANLNAATATDKYITPEVLGNANSIYLDCELTKIAATATESAANKYIVVTPVTKGLSYPPRLLVVKFPTTNTGDVQIAVNGGSLAPLITYDGQVPVGAINPTLPYLLMLHSSGMYVILGMNTSSETNTIYADSYTVPIILPAVKKLNFGMYSVSSGLKIFKLPASPVLNQRCFIYDGLQTASPTNIIRVNGNGNSIWGTTDVDIDNAGDSIEAYWNGIEWVL